MTEIKNTLGIVFRNIGVAESKNKNNQLLGSLNKVGQAWSRADEAMGRGHNIFRLFSGGGMTAGIVGGAIGARLFGKSQDDKMTGVGQAAKTMTEMAVLMALWSGLADKALPNVFKIIDNYSGKIFSRFGKYSWNKTEFLRDFTIKQSKNFLRFADNRTKFLRDFTSKQYKSFSKFVGDHKNKFVKSLQDVGLLTRLRRGQTRKFQVPGIIKGIGSLVAKLGPLFLSMAKFAMIGVLAALAGEIIGRLVDRLVPEYIKKPIVNFAKAAGKWVMTSAENIGLWLETRVGIPLGKNLAEHFITNQSIQSSHQREFLRQQHADRLQFDMGYSRDSNRFREQMQMFDDRLNKLTESIGIQHRDFMKDQLFASRM